MYIYIVHLSIGLVCFGLSFAFAEQWCACVCEYLCVVCGVRGINDDQVSYVSMPERDIGKSYIRTKSYLSYIFHVQGYSSQYQDRVADAQQYAKSTTP